MGWIIQIMVIRLQWNSMSLLTDGQEYKHFIKETDVKPAVVCVQQTWLEPPLDFVVHEFMVTMKYRNYGGGGGCAMFIKQDIP